MIYYNAIKPPEIVPQRFNLVNRLCVASQCLNALAVALWLFVAYVAPVYQEARANEYGRQIMASAIPSDVNAYVVDQYAERHPKPIRKPKLNHKSR